jgi:drug/metabolite transporter (DMT)-like permease
VDAVAFALAAALSFGVTPMSVRRGLARSGGDVIGGVIGQALIGLTLCGGLALVRGDVHGNVLPFVLTGLLVPGLSTWLLTSAVREAGPSRASVVMNTGPLLSVVAALVLLDEPFHIALVLGAVLIVVGGVALAREARPEHVRTIGLVFALLTAVTFAVRDNLVRWLSFDTGVGPQLAGAATLVGAMLFAAIVILAQPTRRQAVARLAVTIPAFSRAGVLMGIAYITMYEAFFRGRVSVVSPLLATAGFFAVLVSWTFLQADLVGRRLVVGAVLIVAGGMLIGIYR